MYSTRKKAKGAQRDKAPKSGTVPPTGHTCAYISARVLHTQYIHIACMRVHKNWFSATHMPYKHMKKCMQFVCNCLHAACMLYINNCMYATHNNCTPCIHLFRCVRPHVHVCGMRVVLSQFLCMQHTYNMDVLCVQHVCSLYAQYVQQGSRYMCSTQATIL